MSNRPRSRGTEKAGAYVSKAVRHLRWAKQASEELLLHGSDGRMDDFERTFYSLLTIIASVHDALMDAAKALNLSDWRAQLKQLRETDCLLWYLYKARDSEVHDTLLKWRPGMAGVQFHVRDPMKLRSVVGEIDHAKDPTRLLLYAYETNSLEELGRLVAANRKPSQERLDAAGVQLIFAIHSLALMSFESRLRDGTVVSVKAPSNHLGREVSPCAHSSIESALGFYSIKLAEIQDHVSVAKGSQQAP